MPLEGPDNKVENRYICLKREYISNSGDSEKVEAFYIYATLI